MSLKICLYGARLSKKSLDDLKIQRKNNNKEEMMKPLILKVTPSWGDGQTLRRLRYTKNFVGKYLNKTINDWRQTLKPIIFILREQSRIYSALQDNPKILLWVYSGDICLHYPGSHARPTRFLWSLFQTNAHRV